MNEDTFPVTDYTVRSLGVYWIFDGRWEVFDNFYEAPVRVDVGWGAQEYQTSEHAFAAAKATTQADHNSVQYCVTPGAAKAVGRMLPLRPDWDQVKFDIMWRVLCAKYEQVALLRQDLIVTRGRVIVEGNTWDDRVWGATPVSKGAGSGPFNVGAKLRGRNALGRMLMMLRDQ